MNENINIARLKLVINENYNININNIVKNEHSTDGNVYMLYAKDNNYVAKIYKDLKHTTSMTLLHKELKLYKIKVPEIICTKNKKPYTEFEDDKQIVIYSFLKGEPISSKFKNKKLDENVINLIAKDLKKLHLQAKENKFNLPASPIENNMKRKSVLHFDLTKENILITDDNEIEFIDFDDAKYGASICDVAIFISLIFFSKTKGVDLEGANQFIKAYYGKNIKLKNKEILEIKDIAIKWINYILSNNVFDSSMIESFKIKKELIIKYLNFI